MTSALSEEIHPNVENTSYSQVGKIEDNSSPMARRFSSRIVIPLGRSHEEVTATLERAAKELMEQTNADAIMIGAYRPGDMTDGMYSVGQVIYAPNGKWEDAATNGQRRFSIAINKLYFAPSGSSKKPGDIIYLQAPINNYVIVSRKYGSWHDNDIIARVSNGTKAIILERKSEPIGNEELIRYHIRTLGTGKKHEGWVHKGDVR